MTLRLVAALVALGAVAACGFSPARELHTPAAVDAGANAPQVDGGNDVATDCTGKATRSGSFTLTVSAQDGGVDRVFNVHVPPAYDGTSATPVVLNFHGNGSTAAQQAGLVSDMNTVADEEGFIAVHPNGLRATDLGKTSYVNTTTNPRSWNAGNCCPDMSFFDTDDVGFVSGMIDVLEEALCVDAKRVYATGLSNGGMISYRLACDLSERIAAIAPVGAINAATTCTPARPVPVMHFHGTADAVVPYHGGSGFPLLDGGFYAFPSVSDSDADSALRNGCTGGATESYAQGDTTCVTHEGCAAPVTLCTSEGAGHTWPGGGIPPSLGLGPTASGIDASRAMWTFFEENPLP